MIADDIFQLFIISNPYIEDVQGMSSEINKKIQLREISQRQKPYDFTYM